MGGEHTPIEKLGFFADFVRIADWAWDCVSQWDPLARDTVGKQLVRAVDSIGANLVEGDGRFSKADGLHFFVIARASARETRYWLERARDRNLIPTDEIQEQINALESATRKLNALISYRRDKSGGSLTREETAEYDPIPNTEHPIPKEVL